MALFCLIRFFFDDNSLLTIKYLLVRQLIFEILTLYFVLIASVIRDCMLKNPVIV